MSKQEFFRTLSDAIDPYQAFFNYLVDFEGLAPADAWDRVFDGCSVTSQTAPH